jgi:HEPN domain-containing protein
MPTGLRGVAEDYGSAAARHWEDAALLCRTSRFDNAAYLSGYAVECCVKTLLAMGGGRPPFVHDLPTLAGPILELAISLSPALARYSLPTTLEFQEVRNEWFPGIRYSRSGLIDSNRAARWVGAAGQAYESVVISATLDGSLP